MKCFVYAIYNQLCNKIYIGQTKDINLRLKIHNEKLFDGYTKKFKGTWKLVYQEECENRQSALIREKQLKSYQGRMFVKNVVRQLNIPG